MNLTTLKDAYELGQAMASAGFPRETGFLDAELIEAFYQGYDETKIAKERAKLEAMKAERRVA